MHYNLLKLNSMDILDKLEQSFFKHLRSLLDLARGKNGKELDDLLVEQGRDEEEKRAIREVCEEIDLEHEMIAELMKSEENLGKWMERKIEETVKESFVDATEDEISLVKDAVQDSMENEIEEDAEMLNKEADLILSLQEEDNDRSDKSKDEEDQDHE